MAEIGDITIKWASDSLDPGSVYVTGRGDIIAPKCKHGIERGQCLSFECLKHSDIPVRGEKSWDSALQPPSGGLFPNLNQLYYQWTTRPQLYYQWTTQPLKLTWTAPLSGSSLQYQTESPSLSQPEPDAEARDIPVIGYRGWRVREILPASIGPRVAARQGGVELVSVNSQFGAWHSAGVTEAKCHVGEQHKAPSYHCQCGLYVLTSLATAPKWYADRGLPADVVIGAVAGWGNVIQHGNEGWRAEYARPIAFLKTDIFVEQPLLERAAQQYGVPILERKGLELYAAEYGEKFT